MALKGVPVLCAVLLVFCIYQVLGLRVAEQKCQEYINTIASLNPIPVERTNEFVTQTNGVPAKEAEFPHQVRVGKWVVEEDIDNPGLIRHWGGALISEQYVLLSSQVLWAMPDDYISLGRHDYSQNSSLLEMKIERREDFIVHPNSEDAYNDIALLRLKEPVNFTSHIYPACLWTDDSPLQLDKLIATAFTTNNDTEDTLLVKLQMQVVPSQNCSQEYANNIFYEKGIAEEHICVQSLVEWNSTCKLDVGGLLQTLEEGSSTVYRLYGVESSNHECDENHLKFTYTKVQNHLEWIEKIVWGA